MLSAQALQASAIASAQNLGWLPEDRWLLNLPLAAVGGLSIVTRCLMARRCLVLAQPGAFEPEALEAQLREQQITLLSLVPTMLDLLLTTKAQLSPPPSLRAILLGGSAASPALLRRAADARWPVLTTYGLTEACSQVTTQPYGTWNRGELGAGYPLQGIEINVIEGRIALRGPALFSGYLPGPRAASLFSPEGWFLTDDLGQIAADGSLHLLGRSSELITTGGHKVYPLEIEQQLEGRWGIQQACVFGLEDERWGEIIAAAIVGEQVPSLQQLKEALREVLAPYKIPRALCALPHLSLGASQKPDRAGTRSLALAHGRWQRE
jgi:O-succinylbenzoic acid--CoA ligase